MDAIKYHDHHFNVSWIFQGRQALEKGIIWQRSKEEKYNAKGIDVPNLRKKSDCKQTLNTVRDKVSS